MTSNVRSGVFLLLMSVNSCSHVLGTSPSQRVVEGEGFRYDCTNNKIYKFNYLIIIVNFDL